MSVCWDLTRVTVAFHGHPCGDQVILSCFPASFPFHSALVQLAILSLHGPLLLKFQNKIHALCKKTHQLL